MAELGVSTIYLNAQAGTSRRLEANQLSSEYTDSQSRTLVVSVMYFIPSLSLMLNIFQLVPGGGRGKNYIQTILIANMSINQS